MELMEIKKMYNILLILFSFLFHSAFDFLLLLTPHLIILLFRIMKNIYPSAKKRQHLSVDGLKHSMYPHSFKHHADNKQ